VLILHVFIVYTMLLEESVRREFVRATVSHLMRGGGPLFVCTVGVIAPDPSYGGEPWDGTPGRRERSGGIYLRGSMTTVDRC